MHEKKAVPFAKVSIETWNVIITSGDDCVHHVSFKYWAVTLLNVPPHPPKNTFPGKKNRRLWKFSVETESVSRDQWNDSASNLLGGKER